MKRYYYRARPVKKGKWNREISVYEQLKDGRFYHIGTSFVNTGSYRGDRAIAAQILHDEKGYQWAEKAGTHYELKRKDISIIELP